MHQFRIVSEIYLSVKLYRCNGLVDFENCRGVRRGMGSEKGKEEGSLTPFQTYTQRVPKFSALYTFINLPPDHTYLIIHTYVNTYTYINAYSEKLRRLSLCRTLDGRKCYSILNVQMLKNLKQSKAKLVPLTPVACSAVCLYQLKSYGLDRQVIQQKMMTVAGTESSI